MSIGDGVSGTGRGSPLPGSDQLAEIERKVRQGRDLRNWEGGELLGEIARLTAEVMEVTGERDLWKNHAIDYRGELERARAEIERLRNLAAGLEPKAHQELVGWVQYDGDECHNFQYASVEEKRTMERSKVPPWRVASVPVYATLEGGSEDA